MKKKELEKEIEFLEQHAEYLQKRIEENYLFITQNTELIKKLVDKLS